MNGFSLHEELVSLQENDVQFEEELHILDLHEDETVAILDELIESVGEPGQIVNQQILDRIRSFIKHFDGLPSPLAHKFVDLFVSAFAGQIKATHVDLAENAQHNFEQDRIALQIYAFCWHWMMEVAENRWKSIMKEKEKAGVTAKAKTTRAKGKRDTSIEWDWLTQKQDAMKAAENLVALDLSRIIIASSDRDTLFGMITKSLSVVLEDPATMKDEDLKSHITNIFCICVTSYDGTVSHGLQTRIVEQYLREEHLSEFIADLMHTLVVKYENTRLVENVLRHCASKDFNDKDLKLAKAFAKFLTRISEILPKEVLKQMVHIQVFLDSESYTLRMGMLEVIGHIIHNHLAMDSSESAAASLTSYYDVLQERFRDVSSYVRVKVLQVLLRLTERRDDSAVTDIPLAIRPALISLTSGRLHDKASNVRKNAIKLLTKFIQTTPFIAFPQDEGRLSRLYFEQKHRSLEEVLKQKFPKEDLPGLEEEGERTQEGDVAPAAESSVAGEMTNPFDDNAQPAATGSATETPGATLVAGEEELRTLRGFMKYYKDGIRFVKQIEDLVPTMCQLLASNVKGEVVEAMNFFVVAHQYQMECANVGVRQMVHKVWDKDAGETERMSVRDHLMRSYIAVYFENGASERLPEEEIADNLIRLTFTMTLAELTSLEQLISMLVTANAFKTPTLQLLWTVFASKKQPPRRRRGAIMIIGMVGKAKKEIIADNWETLLKIGLGESAKHDLVLARYTCIALQQLGAAKRTKGSVAAGQMRFPVSHPVVTCLKTLLLEPSSAMEWFGFAEQAVNTIYLLSEQPDETCGEIVKHIAARVLGFSKPPPVQDGDDPTVELLSTQMERNLMIGEEGQSETATLASCDPLELAGLCFIVGHVAIKEIVHLEAVESEWKRRKHAEDLAKTPRKQGAADELDQVTGTAEDEFSEAIAHIRERELLFGNNTLLGSFGPLIAFICANNRSFNNPILQIMAVLALCKFMCISPDFCDAHLQLLFTILEKSEDAIIRSNAIIGLGDMTVCFNSLIDQNISYLYNRLKDNDPTVKKNTLMVLTFLILNGMVKVKGQTSEMAKCLEDEDQRISDLAKLFFTELASKDNAVYNNLPDIISNLSNGETGVSEVAFANIMKFLLDFIKKDKQTENIVEKLCLRFRNADTPRQWRDISFCLSLLSFSSEKSIRKFVEHLPQYQDKLHEPTLFKHFLEITAKAWRG
ncbi:non-SMC mitotic condensation complex subunit 1-domain-containing protein [Fimicolochytrium jonesii]|uniref:non-SMC mitotic condensation complex subunit 1-domain-containing protein n=1 Tax=Fimicolochytrium jonesii TaxID=1396493 RepID=UPI0022FDC7AB|nr:non-SMC mitotic condensation complex subunit 1-domain-containing protein [Fimicolochytrium jonesii]KAI8826762.1 non-SMC mitotic condensation complex subunit 1-domain-containing protein [Fimicolochytrium jonesii]